MVLIFVCRRHGFQYERVCCVGLGSVQRVLERARMGSRSSNFGAGRFGVLIFPAISAALRGKGVLFCFSPAGQPKEVLVSVIFRPSQCRSSL